MKKRVFLFGILILFLIANGFFIIADTDAEKIEKAYDCLLEKIDSRGCGDIETSVFSLLAAGECKTAITGKVKTLSNGQQCWPSPSCDIKTTAQAILALDRTSFDTSKAEEWLLAQKAIPTDMTWYLQIDSNEETECSIKIDGDIIYEFTLELDKTITTTSEDSYFKPAQSNYWLKINKNHYGEEFEISCETDYFLTNLIYQKDNSNVFFILKQTNIGNLNDPTFEQISSYCFKQGNSCDYEGSLWATLVLSFVESSDQYSDVLPYLITMADSNEKYLPEAFLYYLGYPEFRDKLLGKQKSAGSNKGGYWLEDTSRFYDTALALYPFVDLYPFVGEELTEKTKAKTWLLSNQANDYCWATLRDTAFILHSIFGYDSSVDTECFDNKECDTDEKCWNNQCVPDDADCISDIDCSSPTPVCDIDNYICVACLYDTNCEDTPSTPNCLTTDNICVECEEDGDCTEEGYGCNENNQCYELPECVNISDCNESAGEICLAGYCLPSGPCINDGDCGDEYCDGNGTCVECILPAHPCSILGYECINNSCEIEDRDDDFDDLDCADVGFCRSGPSCIEDSGTILTDYSLSCPIPKKCCSVEEVQQTCRELYGTICNPNQNCDGLDISGASDLRFGETCCDGNCEDSTTLSECENYGGTCRASCYDDERDNSDDCDDFLDECCVASTPPPNGDEPSYLWVWILLILIVLVVIGMVFRDKLRVFFMRFKSKFGNKPGPRPGFPPPGAIPRRPIPRRPMSRRILPPTQKRPPGPRPTPKPKEEKSDLDDVLKKLKDIGK